MTSRRPIERGQVARIVWLTDLSDRAAACSGAVRWLAGLGVDADSASVWVVNAQDDSASGDEARTAAAKAQVAALAGDLGSVGIDAQALVRPGTAAEVARSVCEEVGADLCVIGRSGASDLHRLLLGSTARRLLRELHTSVLIVHDPSSLPPRSVLCPVDPDDADGPPSEAALRGLNAAVALARSGRARLTCASVAMANDIVAEDRLKVGRALERRVRGALLGGKPVDLGFRVLTAPGVAEGIAEAASRADLLVLGTTPRQGLSRLFLGSTAEALVASCPVNTLVVR